MFLNSYQIDDTILNAIKLVNSNQVSINFEFQYLQYGIIYR